MRNRRVVPLMLCAMIAVGASGCDRGGVETDTSAPSVLVVSESWVASQGAGGEGAEVAGARISSLQDAITRLHEETGTGWIGWGRASSAA